MMTHNKLNQAGSTVVLVVVAVAVIVGVGVVGYRISKNNDTLASSDTVKPAANTVPKEINSTAEVKQANAAITSTNVDSSVNPDDLNGDVNSIN